MVSKAKHISISLEPVRTGCNRIRSKVSAYFHHPSGRAPQKESNRGTVRQKRRPWTDEEVLKLNELPEDDALYAATRLCLYAGLRTEEACVLKTQDIDLNEKPLKITQGKNDNALRVLPLHDNLTPFLTRLKEEASDQWLVPGLKPSGKDGQCSHDLSKRAGRWVQKHVSKNTGLVLYTLRHTCLTHLKQTGVEPLLIQRVAGYVSSEITFNTYSTGASLETMRETIDTLPFTVLRENRMSFSDLSYAWKQRGDPRLSDMSDSINTQ